MARGKRKETGANTTDVKKAKVGLHAGDMLPALPELYDDADNAVQLTEVVKTSGVALFFFPKANTPGCTKQAAGFSEHVDAFEKAGYKVFGMSADKPKALASWKDKNNFNFSLLSGTDEALKALGVKKGKGVQRSHLVVAKGGTLKDVSIGVTPAASPVDALAAAAGEEAVPAREAAEATAEKAGAAAEQQNEAEVKDKAEEMEGVTAANGTTAAGDAKLEAAPTAVEAAAQAAGAAESGTAAPATPAVDAGPPPEPAAPTAEPAAGGQVRGEAPVGGLALGGADNAGESVTGGYAAGAPVAAPDTAMAAANAGTGEAIDAAAPHAATSESEKPVMGVAMAAPAERHAAPEAAASAEGGPASEPAAAAGAAAEI